MEANENSGERKIKRFKVRERERGGSGKEPSSLPRPSSFFPRSPAARRTDPLTEGLEQATMLNELHLKTRHFLVTIALNCVTEVTCVANQSLTMTSI